MSNTKNKQNKQNKKNVSHVIREKIDFMMSFIPSYSTIKLTYYNDKGKTEIKKGILRSIQYICVNGWQDMKEIVSIEIDDKMYYFLNKLTTERSFFEILELNISCTDTVETSESALTVAEIIEDRKSKKTWKQAFKELNIKELYTKEDTDTKFFF
jgi:hypothetical protein